MKNPMARMREMYSTMGENERAIADVFLDRPQAALGMNVRDLAAELFVSPSTVVRFCQHLGFQGYRDFRQSLIYETAMYAEDVRHVDLDITRDNSLESIVEKTTLRNVMALNETEKLLDMDTLRESVELIEKAECLLFFGIGASGTCAKDAYMKFLRVNKSCQMTEDYHAQLMLAKKSTRRDVGIIITYSGETTEMIECLHLLRQNQTPSIVITRFGKSSISRVADRILYMSAQEPLFNISACASRIAQLNVIDILYTAYVVRNYDHSMANLLKTHINKPNIHIDDILKEYSGKDREEKEATR